MLRKPCSDVLNVANANAASSVFDLVRESSSLASTLLEFGFQTAAQTVYKFFLAGVSIALDHVDCCREPE
jgi:hypothetical protein